MVPGVVQRIVDVIGEQVDRPVLVEDPGLRVVAYSEHNRETDTVRRNSILARHTTQDVLAWCRAAGVHVSRKPVRVEPNRDLDFRTRVCVPVHCHGVLLGFVWFIDENRSLTDEDLDPIAAELASLSEAMYADRSRSGAPTATIDPATALLDDAAGAEDAARRLLDDGVLASDGPTSVLVVRHDEPSMDGRPGSLLLRALDACRGRVGPRRVLTALREGHAAVLLRSRADPYDVAARLRLALAGGDADPVAATVGIGGTKPRLAEAPLAYAEALRSARVAAQVETVGPIGSWDELGVYRMLARLDAETVDVATVHPGLARLLCDPVANRELIATLEAYLDSAGNAAGTSAALHLHRTTLYYRLQRIETLAGTDLKDGDERLCLHLALKLWRLRRESATATP